MRLEKTETMVKMKSAADNFVLSIEGLGLLYQKTRGDKWKICFPDSWDHTLSISFYKGIGKNLEEIPGMSPCNLSAGSVISIEHKGAAQFAERPAYARKIFDMSEFHPNLKLLTPQDLMKNASILNLKDTKLEPIGKKRKFGVWKYNNEGKTKISKVELSVALGGTVTIDPTTPNAQTTVEILDTKEVQIFYELFPYSQSGNEKYTIKISNHCNRYVCDYQSDFNLYYKLLDRNSLENTEYDLEYIESKKEEKGAKAPCNVIYSTKNPE
jgi:hypothetical protein